ncbi:hypothetical protein BDQ17DRAFT_1006348 [Cyathus striatus]|nr:hypothetical protein BDQ17DRAFT_1006348 [Cyathus striatus]
MVHLPYTELFVSLLEQHGADFRRIASSMPNQQTSTQISLYYKHNREKLSLEKIAARAPKRTKSPDPSLNNPMSASVMTASTATSIKSVGRIPKVRTNGTSATTEPKAKSNEDEAPPMGSLTPPPPVTAPTSSQEPKMPEILKGWGSIMSRERPPPPPPRHAPKPKHTSRRPQSMSEVHSPSSSPPQSNASLPSTPVTSSFIPAAILPALPASLPPRPIAGLPAKPAPATTGLSRHYPTANYASTTNAASSSSASNNSKPTTSAIPMAATGITTGVNLPMIPLNRAPRTPSGYSTTGSGTTSYQASASSAYPSRPSPYAVYPYGGEQRYPPVYGPPPPPRPPFTATSSGSSTGTTGQKDGHSHYSVYPHGGSYYYSSSS